MLKARFIDNRKHTMQLRALIRLMIEERKGEVHDALTITHLAAEKYGISFDWHEASDVLDIMNTARLVKVAGHDRTGMTSYYITLGGDK